MAGSKDESTQHFNSLRASINSLSMQEALHKAIPPSQVMTWLGLEFNTVDMSITISKEKLADIMQLIREWSHKVHTNIHHLHMILGKLFYVAQCCPPAKLFINRMLYTLKACQVNGTVPLSTPFQKDIKWVRAYLVRSNDVYMMHVDDRVPKRLFVDAFA